MRNNQADKTDQAGLADNQADHESCDAEQQPGCTLNMQAESSSRFLSGQEQVHWPRHAEDKEKTNDQGQKQNKLAGLCHGQVPHQPEQDMMHLAAL